MKNKPEQVIYTSVAGSIVRSYLKNRKKKRGRSGVERIRRAVQRWKVRILNGAAKVTFLGCGALSLLHRIC